MKNRKYYIDLVFGSSLADCYYQLVRVKDEAILCAYSSIDLVWQHVDYLHISRDLVYEL